ncbi:MAG TPA: HEAT repeat domain-containing protein, partial [Longimicrobiales bacterium]|nr:HEAT repeat domain-containing protein [Longimicrobiales bacterium]
ARVQALLVTLAKTFRAYQLYDENNPVRRRFGEQLRSELQALWQDVDRLVLRVDEDHMYLGGTEVYASESRNDSLAFLFFKDGVREITLLPGLEGEELDKFLGVLQRARKLVPEGDDLLTVLWEADLRYFQYQYVDLLAEGVTTPEAGAGNTPAELQAALAGVEQEAEAERQPPAPGSAAEQPQPQTVRQDDFNPTLYALDAHEMNALRAELAKELQRDTRADVLNALFDRLEEPHNRERQSQILRILETLLPNFLSRGALVAATSVLQELRRLESAPGIFDEQRIEESRRILDRISSSSAIEELIQALFDGTIRASASQLSSFLQFLRGGALAPLLRAAESVDHKELQAVLRKAVQGIANRNRSAVLALLEEDDPIIASGAARLAGTMQISEAGPALARLLAHADPSVRLAAVEAAVELKASTAASALERTLDDPERELRIAAARALGALRYRPAASKLEKIVKSREIRSADISEKVAVFQAYGVVAEADGLELLDHLLNGKGFLGKREPTDIRAAAALALGRIPGPEARAALEKAIQDDDPVVRSNVNRALRSEA